MVTLEDIQAAQARIGGSIDRTPLRANILQISHDRLTSALPLDRATVEISLDTRHQEHQQEILQALDKAGYAPRRKD